MRQNNLILVVASVALLNNTVSANESQNLLDLSLEDLMKIEVTSVSKKAQSLADAAAAVFVINQEDIKRSGATNIPDVLRMAPGVEVGRIDSNKWAVSARGFNGRFANKLLVLIDGRSIYTQAFSGVYWENQDVMLEDVDRIEVIRGPGAALWGANAVNGVINIITKNSSGTKGGLVTAGGGSQETGFGSLRYGTNLGKDTTGRFYAKGFQRNEFNHLSGDKAQDGWNKVQGGFRIDSTLTPKDNLTVAGDVYYTDLNQSLSIPSLRSPTLFKNIKETTNTAGGNLRSRLEHTFSSTANYALQFYYDAYNRNEIYDHELRQTVDIEFQNNFALNNWNDVLWGLGYRYMDSQNFLPIPSSFSLRSTNPMNHYYNAFVQDKITLVDDKLWLTLGTKFEHNDYSGFEVQPTARLLWVPEARHRLWGAISRAVRTPSVIEDGMSFVSQYLPPNSGLNPSPFPVAAVVNGSSNFVAEELLAYELGYRFTMSKSLTLDSTAFYNDYQSLRSIVLGNPGIDKGIINQPLLVSNSGIGQTYGFETALSWQMQDWWRWDLSYSYLHTHITTSQFFPEAVSPQNKVSIRSVMSPLHNVNLDLWLRYVDNSSYFTVRGPVNIDNYVTLDVRLAWKPLKMLEISLTGQNLLDSNNLEAVEENYTRPTEIPRSVYGKIAFEF